MIVEITNRQIEALREILALKPGENCNEDSYQQIDALYNKIMTKFEKREGKSFTKILSLLYTFKVRVKLPEWGGWWQVVETNDKSENVIMNSDGTIVEPSRIALYANRTDWIIEEIKELSEKDRTPLDYIHVGDVIVFYEEYKGKRNKGIMLVKGFDYGNGEAKTSAPRCIWGKTPIDGTWYGDWADGSVFYKATSEEEQELFCNVPNYMVPSIEKLLNRRIRTIPE